MGHGLMGGEGREVEGRSSLGRSVQGLQGSCVPAEVISNPSNEGKDLKTLVSSVCGSDS